MEEQDAGAAEVAAREDASQVPTQEGYPARYSSSAPASQFPTQDYGESASEDASQSTSQQPVLLRSIAGGAPAEEDEERSKGSGGAEVKVPGKRKRLQQADSSDEEETGEGTTADEACGAAVGGASGNAVQLPQEDEEADPTDWRERTKASFSCANLGLWLLRVDVHLFAACELK